MGLFLWKEKLSTAIAICSESFPICVRSEALELAMNTFITLTQQSIKNCNNEKTIYFNNGITIKHNFN